MVFALTLVNFYRIYSAVVITRKDQCMDFINKNS